ncbi:LLM class flavin-dependent oxidoreductase [Saccharopolyspora indica]|uniref:LLM class flavin-dependent oxidoreductase n=1 Tax=Saccharopolyspora indica TaxID=1229659 RepID=UPI0022EADC85|nr:LLM class flavin-dependent oxidoreductase [Saccharopolyspora indica]MDA3647657.1 LLM class flavin-dependent oxidoreductase [Saccharopolyspora indica]
MDIGVGLPATIPGTPARHLLEWARRADTGGFSTLGALDRLVYDNYEPLTALAAAAGVTERIQLATTILIAPYRADVAVLAKQAATVDRLSGGRLILGMAAGFRADDFAAGGTEHRNRGRRLDAMVERMRALWSGTAEPGFDHPVGPVPAAPPRLVFGGHSEGAVRRAARFGWGWIAGGSSPNGYRTNLQRARAVWAADGLTREPRKLALSYFALGPDAHRHAEDFLGDYYGFLGEEYATRVVKGALVDEQLIRQTVEGYREAGCDELIFMPCSSDPEQVDLLAEAVR